MNFLQCSGLSDCHDFDLFCSDKFCRNWQVVLQLFRFKVCIVNAAKRCLFVAEKNFVFIAKFYSFNFYDIARINSAKRLVIVKSNHWAFNLFGNIKSVFADFFACQEVVFVKWKRANFNYIIACLQGLGVTILHCFTERLS